MTKEMNNKDLIRSLIDNLNKWTAAYDEGNPLVSDLVWDNAFFDLAKLEKRTSLVYPDSPTQRIFYKEVPALKKVKHNHKMLSLDKTKDEAEFEQYFKNEGLNKDVCLMLKLDGLTCSLKYKNGELVSAETRGNGEIGEDILHNAMVIKSIPKKIPYKDTLIVDGEILCTYFNFENFKSEYKNPRNFAAGSIRLLDNKECENRNLDFIVWNVIKGFDEENAFSEKLLKVENLGFKTVPFLNEVGSEAKDSLLKIAKNYGYPIDGLVGRFNDVSFGNSLGETAHHSKAAYAFKFYDERYETTLLDIEWTMGKSGQLTPVAVFEPVDDGESVIQRASLHNINIMKEILSSNPFKGEKIFVVKMNQIIPQIVEAETSAPAEAFFFEIPTKCPCCGSSTEVITSDSGTKNLYCSNSNCSGQFINILDHFCGKKGLDIKGLSKKTLEKLIDWEWVSSLEDIFNLNKYKNEWIEKSGFGEKSVNNILTAIEEKKSCSLENFISSLSISLIGKSAAKVLSEYFCTWEDFRAAIENGFDFEEIPDFGEITAKNLSLYDWNKVDSLIENCDLKIVAAQKKEVSSENLSLKGLNFVITGSLKNYKNRSELTDVIRSLGGEVKSAISKNTNYLINNNKNSTSKKNKEAQELNIEIITEEEFKERFC